MRARGRHQGTVPPTIEPLPSLREIALENIRETQVLASKVVRAASSFYTVIIKMCIFIVLPLIFCGSVLLFLLERTQSLTQLILRFKSHT